MAHLKEALPCGTLCASPSPQLAASELLEDGLLYFLVASFQEGNAQLDRLGEDLAVGRRLDDEVDDELGAALIVQVALDRVQRHLGPTQELVARPVRQGLDRRRRHALHRRQWQLAEIPVMWTEKSTVSKANERCRTQSSKVQSSSSRK